MLQNPCDVALFSSIRWRLTVRLNRQKMPAGELRSLCDLEIMFDEIPLCVTEIGPIEPDIALVAETIDS